MREKKYAKEIKIVAEKYQQIFPLKLTQKFLNSTDFYSDYHPPELSLLILL